MQERFFRGVSSFLMLFFSCRSLTSPHRLDATSSSAAASKMFVWAKWGTRLVLILLQAVYVALHYYFVAAEEKKHHSLTHQSRDLCGNLWQLCRTERFLSGAISTFSTFFTSCLLGGEKGFISKITACDKERNNKMQSTPRVSLLLKHHPWAKNEKYVQTKSGHFFGVTSGGSTTTPLLRPRSLLCEWQWKHQSQTINAQHLLFAVL